MLFQLQTVDQLKPLIQGFRKRAGLTQAAMAEKLGITQQSYAQIESNLNATSVERLYTILRLLDVEISFSSSGQAAPENARTRSRPPSVKPATLPKAAPRTMTSADKTKW